MQRDRFIQTCIYDTLEGLRGGLSQFSAPSRVAVIYAHSETGPLRIYDPQHLLNEHEPIIRELYLDQEIWRHPDTPLSNGLDQPGFLHPEEDLQLSGLISFGGRSQSIYYQRWFTEHHPELCDIGPTERWLEHAAWRLAHDLANEVSLYSGISGAFLREYANHAVRDHIIDEMSLHLGIDTHLRVYPILDAILEISRTREEGAWPRGELTFAAPRFIHTIRFMTRFPDTERPSLGNAKHVRKLLQAVELSDRWVVSNGQSVVGISCGEKPPFRITADYQGGFGFLRINGQAVCSFTDGHFYATQHRAKLVEVEEALLETELSSEKQRLLFTAMSQIVHRTQENRFGCTLILDLNDPPISIPGHHLDPPLKLYNPHHLELIQSLAKVDGALHISTDLKLNGFASIMDGKAIAAEDRARGARYNSALRFTAANSNLLVVVVSSDRPVSIIRDGMELNARCDWAPFTSSHIIPPDLHTWLADQKQS
jgi:hypothetical protein